MIIHMIRVSYTIFENALQNERIVNSRNIFFLYYRHAITFQSRVYVYVIFYLTLHRLYITYLYASLRVLLL